MNNVTTFDNFPPFATNGSRNMDTESAKYAVGFLEGETFPAEWANYLFHGATKGVSDLNTAVQSIWKENINVIQGSGQTPSSSDNTQLKTAIELMIQNALAQAKLDAHPVGSLYWSSDPTDPSTLFGGTWVQIKDRFIWAKGDEDTVNDTGGSKTVQLTESNLPAHQHDMTHSHSASVSGSNTSTDISHSHSFSWTGSHSHKRYANTESDGWFVEIETKSTGYYVPALYNDTDPHNNAPSIDSTKITVSGDTTTDGGSHSHSWSGEVTIDTITANTGSVGSGSAHENMPPYIVKYCWERVS